MRLSTIKLAGFKSFVDPTTLHLPTNMTGVVGPNGCGNTLFPYTTLFRSRKSVV